MNQTLDYIAPDALVLHLGPVVQRMTDDEFYEFCQKHPDLRIERSSEGDLIILPPTGGETGHSNFKLTVHFGNWVEKDGAGPGFDSSTVFRLPNGADRSPDVAWVRRERWEALTAEEREKFPPLCPDFVIELRSRTDRLRPLQDKLEEYIENGAQLGWLIDPQEKKVWIYRPNSAVECLDHPSTVSGDPELPGFLLPPDRIWN
ncbi:MAG TPA: Uma2 family endonuclease [Blastocatellia bacterium]|nr:Uma2 family endonuclease [Blastocatellia bacterium]